MRIQHNIPAMSAYRNYTNNTSSLAKNLEKLSSGYRINRAGDDAAGLAISEKMRAQISGLDQAQANAKDGISLVQTAEGALTEVHDMLNRMVTLSEQSANGTYDNDVDRLQLQKELDQLRDEVNRIADSSNFNGIKLLDGSMDATGGHAVESAMQIEKVLPQVGDVLGTNTVLHNEGNSNATVSFELDLHNVEFDNTQNKEMTLVVGGAELKLTGQSASTTANPTNPITGAALVSAFVGSVATDATLNKKVVTLTGGDGKQAKFEISKGTTDTRIKFTKLEGADGGESLRGDVSIQLKDGNGKILNQGVINANSTSGSGSSSPAGPGGAASVSVSTPTGTSGLCTAAFTFEGSATEEARNTLQASLNNKTISFSVSVVSSTGKLVFSGLDGLSYDLTVDGVSTGASGNIYTLDTSDLSKSAANVKVAFKDASGTVVGNLAFTVNINGANAGDSASVTLTGTAGRSVPAGGGSRAAGGTVEKGEEIKGDYNISAVNIQNVDAPSDKRLASTKFELTADMIKNGASIRIGTQNYVFKTSDDGFVNPNGGIEVDLSDLDQNSSDFIHNAAVRLTHAAAGNELYTVGTSKDAPNVVTLTEIDKGTAYGKPSEYDNVTKFDLRTEEGIEASLGFTGPVAAAGDLTLQIGDTAESFNQLRVNIGDCHTSAMGTENGKSIADISIATQEGAAEALDVIKNAINYVSDVRGTLGATQNRLDHTINNLSVMEENIQDAESTIRDTDVAEEMMAYTKNSILVQSAQAMLAQANQLPQGVLQLLQ